MSKTAAKVLCIEIRVPHDSNLNPEPELAKFFGAHIHYPVEFITGLSLDDVSRYSKIIFEILILISLKD